MGGRNGEDEWDWTREVRKAGERVEEMKKVNGRGVKENLIWENGCDERKNRGAKLFKFQIF